MAFKKYRHALLAAVTGGLAIILGVQLQSPVTAAALAAHRAVYDLKLDRAQDGRGITDVTGRMVFEFVGNACEGYTVNMRYRTAFANSDGQVAQSDIQSSTWESGDGERFSFTTRQYLGSSLSDETRGNALREDPAGSIAIQLSQPEEKTLDAASETLFPTQHFLALIEAALKGKRFFRKPVYDGSNHGDKIYETNAVIGTPEPVSSESVDDAVARDIAGKKAWPVTIAYFENDEPGEQLPSYQISFNLFENGVSTKLVLDYGDFVLKGRLVSLEMLESGPCEADKVQ